MSTENVQATSAPIPECIADHASAGVIIAALLCASSAVTFLTLLP